MIRSTRFPAADSPSRDVKNTKFDQYLPVVLTSPDVSNLIFESDVIRYDIATSRDGAWHNDLFVTTANNVNWRADVANHVTRLWQAGDMEI